MSSTMPQSPSTSSLLLFFSLPLLSSSLALARRSTPAIYDALILRMTSSWYAAVISDLPQNATVLDIGMGTGTSLLSCLPSIKAKNLAFTGVDITPAYVLAATSSFASSSASSHLTCVHGSVYDSSLLSSLSPPTLFTAVYFSGSIALLPDPGAALLAVADVLADGGLVYVTQTFQKNALPGMALAKPLIKHLTTIDFGAMRYESEILAVYAACGETLELVTHGKIEGSVDNFFQAAFLTVLRKRGS